MKSSGRPPVGEPAHQRVCRAAAGDPVLSPDVARSVIAMAARNQRDDSDPGPTARARMQLLTNRIQLAMLAHESRRSG